MRRMLFLLVPALALASFAIPGNPHFVGGITVTRTGDTLTVSGKEAGLGNETQVHIVLTVSARCVNPGGKKPKAGNKQSFTAEGVFPVQNGKALFTLSVTPTFQPGCTPPMTVEFSNVSVCDVDHDVCKSFPGTF